jgi:heme/copper-type cytochrome/quinol oxidase subunit 2
MEKRLRVPIGLPGTAVALLAVGIVANIVIPSVATPEQLADNVLLNAIPFILIFVSIILGFITLIVFTASRLNHNIGAATHRAVETLLIAGIVLGVFGMFQPWFFSLYKIGFMLLLLSTLGFILWSHIVPKRANSQ